MKTILVLEDNLVRVDWLKHFFPEINVVSTATVSEFLTDFYDFEDHPSLYILDHDLGLSFFEVPTAQGNDKNGHNGTYLANHLPFTDTPILVWSQNDRDGPKMTEILRHRGFNVRYVPFPRFPNGDFEPLRLAIVECLQD